MVLEKGRVREQGSPQQLMTLEGGLFRQLVQQAAHQGDGRLDTRETAWVDEFVGHEVGGYPAVVAAAAAAR